jgi:hypothetical protein
VLFAHHCLLDGGIEIFSLIPMDFLPVIIVQAIKWQKAEILFGGKCVEPMHNAWPMLSRTMAAAATYRRRRQIDLLPHYSYHSARLVY